MLLRLAFILTLCANAHSQSTFHWIHGLDAHYTAFSSVFVHDSSYYLAGGKTDLSTSKTSDLFMRLNSKGESKFENIVSKNSTQLGLKYSKTKPTLSKKGTLLYASNQYSGTTNSIPQLLEFSLTGQLVNNIIYDTLLKSDSLILQSGGQVINNQLDSSHYLCYNFNKLNSFISGVILIKITKEYTIEKFIRLEDPYASNQFHYVSLLELGIHQLPGGNLIVACNRQDMKEPASNYTGSTVFFELTPDLNIVSKKSFQDTQYDCPTFGGLPLPNGEYLLSYFGSKPKLVNNKPVWEHRSVIALLDTNYQLKWKSNFGNYFYEYSGIPEFSDAIEDFEFVDDSTFVCGANHHLVNESTPVERVSTYVKIIKHTVSNKQLWERKYNYFKLASQFPTAAYFINDVEQTQDSGFIFTGEVYDMDSSEISAKSYGYVLKTNCLGFMGAPLASFTPLLQTSLTSCFKNTSIQAGSYLWDFGDGTTLTTEEYQDTVYHTYPDSSATYTVRLIAYGCNGEADTISFPYSPSTTSLSESTQNFLHIFPNPTGNAGNAYLYLNGLAGDFVGSISIVSTDGKQVEEIHIGFSEGTLLLPILESGMYNVVLKNKNGEILHDKKLVVL